jgi:ABC-type branched-subunit amino acid transport system substrate-binding protein
MSEFNRSRLLLPMVAGIGALSLMLAGCAAESDGPADTTEEQSTTTAPAVDSVQIGLISPLSGPFADNGLQARLGTELCVNQINEAGGIQSLGGAQIELIIQDTGPAAPADVANQLQSIIDKNELSAVIGAWASSYTLAAIPVAEENKVPMVTESFADDIVKQGYKYIFKLPASSALMGSMATEAILELAAEQGIEIRTAAVVADNTSSAQVSAEAAKSRFESLGVDVPVSEFFTPGLTTADSIAIKVLASDPQVIFVQGSLGDMAILQRAFRDKGYAGPLLGAGSGFVTVDYAKTIGIEETNGTLVGIGTCPVKPPRSSKKTSSPPTPSSSSPAKRLVRTALLSTSSLRPWKTLDQLILWPSAMQSRMSTSLKGLPPCWPAAKCRLTRPGCSWTPLR